MVRKNITLDIVRAGLHCSLSMSRQIFPLLLMLGWNTLVLNATCKILNRRYSHITILDITDNRSQIQLMQTQLLSCCGH
jgi:hypothetical protein